MSNFQLNLLELDNGSSLDTLVDSALLHQFPIKCQILG
jgi:hypothetical protein